MIYFRDQKIFVGEDQSNYSSGVNLNLHGRLFLIGIGAFNFVDGNPVDKSSSGSSSARLVWSDLGYWSAGKSGEVILEINWDQFPEEDLETIHIVITGETGTDDNDRIAKKPEQRLTL
ncbi:MAG: hypothetical protein EOM62_17845 [Bacteroidia bacterium]|nr:hypothetical protein [Bacteroidia bacterium]